MFGPPHQPISGSLPKIESFIACFYSEVMKCFWFFAHVFLDLTLLTASVAVQAFTGTYGINFGRIADNIPSPDKVVALIRAAKIKNVKTYDADHDVFKAFTGTRVPMWIKQ